MYFTDAGAQAAVTGMRWSGAIAPPAGTTDLLVVCNAMNVGSKINIAIRKAVDYEVALKPDGSAETTLILDYSNVAPFDRPPSQSDVFSDYLRVYRAPGTVVVPDAHPAAGSTATVDIGLPTAVRRFKLPRGLSHRETIVTRVPGAWRTGRAAVTSGSPVATGVAGTAMLQVGVASHYRLFIVRQADLQDIPTTVTVTPPAGWRVSSVSAWKVASGAVLAVTSKDSLVRLARPLDGDMVLDVEMLQK
jgi:hypothetical protein